MSKVLRALDISEQNHQAMQQASYYHSHPEREEPAATNKLAVTTLLLLPGLFAAFYSSYDSYQSKLASWLSSNQPQVVEVTAPFAYSELPSLQFGDLTPTYDVIVADVAVETPPVSATPETNVIRNEAEAIVPDVKEQDAPLLDNLDLSELSPELALRIESALGNELEPVANANSELSNLAQQGDKWQGKLPALNFQTHVYSSNAAKRWVKVNGAEYNEGDWISERILLEKIEQNSCQILFDGERIDVPALYDWQG